MRCLPVLIAAIALCATTPVLAQTALAPLGITSPLGIGPGAPVAPVGVPLGATQLTTPGLSSPPAGIVPQSAITGSNSACGGSATLTTGVSSSTALFDGGMTAGTASGACLAAGGSTASPAGSSSSPTGMSGLAPVGRVGIPMGSSELDPGGLSPLPPATMLNPAPLSSTMSSLVDPTASPLGGALTAPPLGTPNSFSATPQTSAGVACAGLPGNINSTATLTAGSC
jgi:hypothetical protein